MLVLFLMASISWRPGYVAQGLGSTRVQEQQDEIVNKPLQLDSATPEDKQWVVKVRDVTNSLLPA